MTYKHVRIIMYIIYLYSCVYTDPAPSSMASFNDSRCVAGGVCLTDPLLFTCELNEVLLLRIVLPNGVQEVSGVGDTADMISLPAGFTAEIFNITTKIGKHDISLTLSIANASLLDGGELRCDDTTSTNTVMARCPLLSKFEFT